MDDAVKEGCVVNGTKSTEEDVMGLVPNNWWIDLGTEISIKIFGCQDESLLCAIRRLQKQECIVLLTDIFGSYVTGLSWIILLGGGGVLCY